MNQSQQVSHPPVTPDRLMQFVFGYAQIQHHNLLVGHYSSKPYSMPSTTA